MQQSRDQSRRICPAVACATVSWQMIAENRVSERLQNLARLSSRMRNPAREGNPCYNVRIRGDAAWGAFTTRGDLHEKTWTACGNLRRGCVRAGVRGGCAAARPICGDGRERRWHRATRARLPLRLA